MGFYHQRSELWTDTHDQLARKTKLSLRAKQSSPIDDEGRSNDDQKRQVEHVDGAGKVDLCRPQKTWEKYAVVGDKQQTSGKAPQATTGPQRYFLGIPLCQEGGIVVPISTESGQVSRAAAERLQWNARCRTNGLLTNYADGWRLLVVGWGEHCAAVTRRTFWGANNSIITSLERIRAEKEATTFCPAPSVE